MRSANGERGGGTVRIADGTVAVVTGGASGIGRSCALEFARRGASVVIADINEERIDETVGALTEGGARALGLRCDVTSDADVARLRDESLAAMGHVDIVMNNAGVALLGPPESVPIDDWRWIIDVNILGIVRGAAAFVPHLLERGSGHIVNTASIAGLHAYSWDAIPYITSKFGAYGLSEGLFAYLKPHGVGVSVLCPGLVTTNLAETARFSGAEDRDNWFSMPERLLNNPISPDGVGPMVADAVQAEQFLILTHPDDAIYLAERRADIEAALIAQVAGATVPPLPKRETT
jgi:NAD(P)-dependent dehydrogenase (short-subunit alcohol dehydrogenase family)